MKTNYPPNTSILIINIYEIQLLLEQFHLYNLDTYSAARLISKYNFEVSK